ncbi:alcohol oxidase [Violaceomyces palustris]|uniref:Alcohol oxidase n=1 Tax=Violaceomyces palustris TaxID=1673888 RepID=A0ACD0NMC8_9BASI|nr:alcohol oxidase [Violaceomyces palustris]
MRFAISLALLATVATSVRAAPSVITSDLSSVQGKDFDYVIVGGGLTGLAVANRLSEDPNVSVLVLEAGNDNRQDGRVKSIYAYGQAFGSELDWSWQATGSKTIRGGKTLGGSTSINGGAWTRGSKEQYEAIANLGNSGWSYEDLTKYMNKAEGFSPPSSAQSRLGAKYDPVVHGSDGPVKTMFSDPGSSSSRRSVGAGQEALERRMYSGAQQSDFLSSIKTALGVNVIDDLSSAKIDGAAYTPNSILNLAGDRTSSATAYLSPIEFSRSNLAVLTGYRGTRIKWDPNNPGKAIGVVVQQYQNGPKSHVNAKREVVLAAGAINTPLLLQRSGVGSKSDLASIGVNQVIDLPGVGKNLQEQTMNTLGARTTIDYGGKGPSNMIAMPSIYELMSNATDVKNYINSNLQGWAQQMVNQGHAVNTQGLINQWKQAVSNIFDSRAPVSELFFDSGYPANSLGIDAWYLLPFSRGSVRASSYDAFSAPNLNPNYFSLPIDMDMTVATLRGARKIFKTQPLAGLTTKGETQPGFSVVPDNVNQGGYRWWRAWVLGISGGGFNSVSHPIATCSMMPEAMGGVVDPNFKLYRSQNVRIVDASVLPVQLSAHLSSTLYGIAEKAADTIKGSST